MDFPKHGTLTGVAIHGKFAFNSIDDICWQYSEEEEPDQIILLLPFDEKYHNYLVQYRNLHCELDFRQLNKAILLQGKILKHDRITIRIAEQQDHQEMLVVQLDSKESLRFLQFLTKGQTEKVEKMERSQKEISVRAKRRHPRLPKKFKVLYQIDLNEQNLKKLPGDAPVEMIELQGETLNISKSGIFIKSEFLPPLGTQVKLLMIAAKGKEVEACGTIIRRIDNPPNSGFAVEVDIKEKVKEPEGNGDKGRNANESAQLAPPYSSPE